MALLMKYQPSQVTNAFLGIVLDSRRETFVLTPFPACCAISVCIRVIWGLCLCLMGLNNSHGTGSLLLPPVLVTLPKVPAELRPLSQVSHRTMVVVY